MPSLRPLALPFLLFTSSLLAASTTGCGDGGGGSGGAGGSGGSGGSGGGSQTVACDEAPTTLNLSGTWAAYGRLAVTLQGTPGGAITICPADQIGESRMLLLVTMSADIMFPKQLYVSSVLCSIELPIVTALVGQCDPAAETLVSTQIVAPQTLIDALPGVPVAPVSGSLDGLSPGAGFALERFSVTVGSSKAGLSMPAWNDAAAGCGATNLGRTNFCEPTCVDDCAGLRDDDADTYPGVTVEVCGKTPDDVKSGVACNAAEPNVPGTTLQGRGFIDMEVNPLFTGQAKSSCELSGTVDSEVLYNLVGADIYLAGTQIGVTSAIKSLPTFQVEPQDSRFRMVRIDGQFGAPDWNVDASNAAAACATLLARQNEL
ncbi:hypothetical protein [Polyangium sp. 6x1]|uniref:hypothetical protein n=1 Tax=Polyangium sp. 6x1 TaxID=3042689 RepID=UPI002482F954|nr:hypothetical protein [Polyangium sp. 6x1]MDI1450344.1 hypothetical protein [Polyangium sp. 6x1]